MTTALAPIKAPLDATTGDAMVEQLRAAQSWVAGSNADECRSTYEKAQLIKEFVRIRKLSNEVATEAVRLECQCLRRMAELDAHGELWPGLRTAAQFLATLSATTFDDMLAQVGPERTALGYIRLYRSQLFDLYYGAEEAAEDEPEEPEEEDFFRHVRDDGTNDNIRDVDLSASAELVLENLAGGRWPSHFTVEYAAGQLLDYYRLAHTPVVKAGARAAVRQALRAPEDASIPAFVTSTDGRGGFVHIAWRAATLRQFREMVEIRERKARDAMLKAQEWRRLLDGMEARARDLSGTKNEKDMDRMECRRLVPS